VRDELHRPVPEEDPVGACLAARFSSGSWLASGSAAQPRPRPGEALRRSGGRTPEALGADLTHWPLQRARLVLAYGRWLRRQRRIAESRTPLRDARDAFDAMGCAAWGGQARRELRASGETSRRRDLAASDQLTAQELQIARLAAQGLSNRDIAQRLYLSHRTIGTHLYRIFPKLGITSRGELRSALSASATGGEG
jgi:DNA-binding CsgD family transcriptional regulator